MNGPMRVVLADDRPKVRSALQLLLKHALGISAVSDAGETKTLLEIIRTIHPDLVLLDWELPGLSAIGSLSALREGCPKLLVIVLSGRPEVCEQALAAGADAFVSKIDPPESLLETLRTVDSRRKDIETPTQP